MSGALDTFDLASLLQALSLSRQHTSIRLWGAQRQDTGEIRIKAGQLLHAIRGPLRGYEAFEAIVQSKHHTMFRVERLSLAANHPEPIGPIASLLLRASTPSTNLGAASVETPGIRPARSNVTPLRNPVPPLPSWHATNLAPTPQIELPNLGTLVREFEGLLCVAIHHANATPVAVWTANPSVDATFVPFVHKLAALQRSIQKDGQRDGQTDGSRGGALLELVAGIVQIEPIDAVHASTFVFDPKTPLGMANLVVSLVLPRLAALIARAPVVAATG